MISEIKLEQFQAYKKTTLKPAKVGITAITGPTNAGKSSIRRAIELVRTNRPSGSAFIMKGHTSCSVTVNEVKRIKKKTVNAYQIGDGVLHKALKGAVPEEVQTALNLGDVNVQKNQHSALFLIDESPGKVAKQLSQLVDLSVVQRVLQNVRGKKKTTNVELAATLLTIGMYSTILEKGAFVTAAHKALSKIEHKQGKIDKIESTLHKVQVKLKIAKQRQSELSKMPNVTALEPIVRNLLKQDKNIGEGQYEINKLNRLVNRSKKTKAQKIFSERWWASFKKTEELHAIEINIRRINSLCRICTKVSTEITTLQNKHITFMQQYKDILGDTCPTCGATIQND